jgi:hypothetical protein
MERGRVRSRVSRPPSGDNPARITLALLFAAHERALRRWSTIVIRRENEYVRARGRRDSSSTGDVLEHS